jgi:hypothetical protein
LAGFGGVSKTQLVLQLAVAVDRIVDFSEHLSARTSVIYSPLPDYSRVSNSFTGIMAQKY